MKTIMNSIVAALFILLVLGACASVEDSQRNSGEQSESNSGEQSNDGKEIPEEAESSDEVAEQADNPNAEVFVLPAPSEIVAVLSLDQHASDLKEAVGEDLASYQALPDWKASIALGRSIADLMIMISDAEDAEISSRLQNVADGMEAVGVADEMTGKLIELQRKVVAGSVSRDRLVREFDRFRATIIREGDQQVGQRNLALIAVGGWARAVNLVSKVMLKTGEVPIGADLLKLRIVVETLLDQVGSAPELQPIAKALQQILPVTADRPEEPNQEEIQVLVENTDQILSLSQNS